MYGYIYHIKKNKNFFIFLKSPEYFCAFFLISRKLIDALFPYIKQIETHLASIMSYILSDLPIIEKNNGHIPFNSYLEYFQTICKCKDSDTINRLILKLNKDLQQHTHAI
jgi:hypothetical protein